MWRREPCGNLAAFADRIGGANYGKGTEIYKFEKIKRAKRAALAAHPERRCSTFGIGENDDMADPLVPRRRQARDRQARKPRLRRQRHRRLQGSRRRLHEEGLRRHARPGDGGQPRHRLEARPGDAAGRVHQPRRRDADDRPRLSRRRHAHQILRRRRSTICRCAKRTASTPISTASPPTSASRAKLLVINYPNSPTGSGATRDFYQRVIDFAQKEQDRRRAGRRPHPAELRRRPPLSFLQVAGAKEVGVEIHSMSKGFNMIGWRMGFVCRPSEDRAGLRRREGQQRLGPVHGHPKGRGRAGG